MNGLFTHTLNSGIDVEVVYIFIDEDETVGLQAEFEISVHQDGMEITDDLTEKDRAKIETEVAHRFKQQVKECRRQADIDKWESQVG